MNPIKKLIVILINSLPLIFLYILSFNIFEAITLYQNLSFFSFNLQMILIYFYVLKFPNELGYGHIFLAGIINDVVIGIPIGTSSLSYLILCFFTSYVRNVTLRTRMLAEWFTFIPALFFSNSAYFIIVNNFSHLSFYYVELLRNSFLTFLFFPIFYYLFNKYQQKISKE